MEIFYYFATDITLGAKFTLVNICNHGPTIPSLLVCSLALTAHTFERLKENARNIS